MRFSVDQHFSHPLDEVVRAFAAPELYAALDDASTVSRPEVVAHDVTGDHVELQLRYRFNGELSSAARAVLDPARLSWVERSTYDLGTASGSFTMVPDHYRDRLRCGGTFRFEVAEGGCRRHCEGDLRVRAPLVAGAVERAIVSGLREHLDDQVRVVDAYLAGR